MNTQIQIFNNPAFGEIRTAGTPEQPLFCLADVCKALDLTAKTVRQRLTDEVVSNYLTEDKTGRKQEMLFVNEDGLYDVILDSRKPEAKAFRKWITSEVLPTIRKRGGYMTAKADETPEEIMARAIVVAQDTLKRTQQRLHIEQAKTALLETVNNDLQKANAELKKSADYLEGILASKATMVVTQIAQDYGMSAKAFNKVLADMNIQRKVNGQWILYAPYNSKGYVHSSTLQIRHNNGTMKTHLNTQWTQEGRLFLYNTLKNVGILPLIEQETQYSKA